MREFIRIRDDAQIRMLLEDFSCVFPHLNQKVESLEAYARKLAQHAQVCVGQEDGIPFGFVAFYANDRENVTAYISLIGVKLSERKKGLGFWLLKQCMRQAKAQGMQRISLEVDIDNPTAIAFYERNGFVHSGQTERNSMYMSRALTEENA